MATKSDIEKQEKAYNKAQKNNIMDKEFLRGSQGLMKTGLGLIFIAGLEALLFDVNIIEAGNMPECSIHDGIAILSTYFGAALSAVGLVSSVITRGEEKNSRERLGEEKERLEKMKEDYNFSRGYD